jgi:5'-3' exonuclease
VDNIEGLKGIGPAKGTKILKDCTNVEELYEAVLKAYDGDTPRVLENGNLLYLQRKQGDVWQPPLK